MVIGVVTSDGPTLGEVDAEAVDHAWRGSVAIAVGVWIHDDEAKQPRVVVIAVVPVRRGVMRRR